MVKKRDRDGGKGDRKVLVALGRNKRYRVVEEMGMLIGWDDKCMVLSRTSTPSHFNVSNLALLTSPSTEPRLRSVFLSHNTL